MYVIPPEQSAEFVSHMEDVLEIYHLPYDPKCPVICMDEQPIQLVKETRVPLPAKPGQPKSVDYVLRSQWNSPNISPTYLLYFSVSPSRYLRPLFCGVLLEDV